MIFIIAILVRVNTFFSSVAAIPEDKALPWVWRENLRLLQDVAAEYHIADLDGEAFLRARMKKKTNILDTVSDFYSQANGGIHPGHLDSRC